MRRSHFASLLGLTFFAATISPAQAKDAPWQSLFNGRDLTGWTPKIVGHPAGDNFANTFRVADGAIHVAYDGYDGRFQDRFGHLFYQTPYRYFRLKLKYRFVSTYLRDTPGWAYSNSGIMFWGQTPSSMTLDQDFPASIEFQLRGRVDDKPRPSGSVCTPGTTIEYQGQRDQRHCIDSSSPTIPNGRWVEAELEVLPSGEIVHKIDGQEVIRYRAVEYDPADATAQPLIAAQRGALMLSGGTVSLQSEGHPVQFKDIKVQPIADAP